MRVCDLMVGDLVLHDGKVIRVDAVHKRKIGYHKTKDKLTWLFSGQFEPIPLTPEILEKNGLTNDYHGSYFEEDEHISLEISSSEYGIYWTINCHEYNILKLEYVHELQHALKLCGINKEIVV
jgi:hypothetical protein